MSGISLEESIIIGICLECFFLGLYSGIFIMYIQLQTSKQDLHKNYIIFYALCALYILSVGTIVLDTISLFPITFEHVRFLQLYIIEQTVVGFCDFIAQSILVCISHADVSFYSSKFSKIYRCWIVWGHNIRFTIVPSILAFAFLGQSEIHPVYFNSLSLATWLAIDGSFYVFRDKIIFTRWTVGLFTTSFIISLTVNALVTGLIAFKISKVYREVKPIFGSQDLGVTGGSKLRSIMFIIIESGMAFFAIQLVQIVLYILANFGLMPATKAYKIIIGIREMFNGITPTIILVRVSMGLSFHDKESMIESITGSLHFAAENPNLNTETGRIGIEHLESRDGPDGFDVQLTSDMDIQMVDR